MTGIFGACSFDRDRRIDARPLFRAARSLPHVKQDRLDAAPVWWATQSDVAPAGWAEDSESRVRAAIVGEIEGASSLAELLRSRGHVVGTDAASLVVAAFRCWGSDLGDHLLGDHAFVVHDVDERVLVLRRGRLARWPLFYAMGRDRCAFSSRLSVLLDAGFVPRVLDLQAAAAYFRLGFVPSPRTCVEGVRAVAPGETLAVREGGVRSLSQTTVDFNVQDEVTPLSEQLDRAESHLCRVLESADAEVWLQSDPASALVATLSGIRSGRSVRTTAGTDDARTRRLAELLGAEHRPVTVEPDVDDVLQLIASMDQPVADPQWVVRSALLCGGSGPATTSVGASPVFCLNPRYPATLTEDAVRSTLPRWVRGAVGTSGAEAALRLSGWSRTGRGLNVDFRRSVRRLGPIDAPADELFHLQHAELRWKVLDAEAPMLAALAMRHGRPVLTPYLVEPVVEIASRLPVRGRIKGRRVGTGLRTMLERHAPERVRAGQLDDASPPVGDWLRNALRDFAEMAFFTERGGLSGVLDDTTLRPLWYAHQLGWVDQGAWLYAMFVFELWVQSVLTDRSP